MKCRLFYSWQSDLPNKDNRSFIEQCITKAVKLSNADLKAELFLDYDRDTRGIAGSPDIADVIFNKIAKTDLFVCDISIVNPDYDGRKSPNPNVLLELGFAAKALGWERIICLYNLKYGRIEDLPFDLTHRRVLAYNSDSAGARAEAAKSISEAIKLAYSRGLLFNPLKDHMKGQIDYCLLEILKQLCCMTYGTLSMSAALAKVQDLLSLDSAGLSALLYERGSVLGFFARNDLSEARKLLEQVFSTLTTSNVYPLEWSVTTLKSMEWIRTYRYLISERANDPLFIATLAPSPLLKVVAGRTMNEANPANSYLLLKVVGKGKGQVLYSGTTYQHSEAYLISPFKINEQAIEAFVSCVFSMVCLANEWLNETGGEFILDPDYYAVR